MRRIVAVALVTALLVALAPVPARAGVAGDVALALGAFAVFNALFLPVALAARPVYVAPAPVVYQQAPAVYVAPSRVETRPGPAVSRQVVHPHGRYVLYGDGVTRAYQWVWIPNPPPPGSAPGY